MINIVVVFPKLEEAKGIKGLLSRHGYTVVAACTTGASAINALENLEDGIVVCGYKFPDMTYLQLRDYMLPCFDMLLVTSPEKSSECINNDIVCLVMPLKANDLINTIEMMAHTISRRRKKLKSIPKHRNEDEKAIIDQAKKVLMEKNNMTEPEAHRYIQKSSMDTGNTMMGTAKMVLEIMLR